MQYTPIDFHDMMIAGGPFGRKGSVPYTFTALRINRLSRQRRWFVPLDGITEALWPDYRPVKRHPSPCPAASLAAGEVGHPVPSGPGRGRLGKAQSCHPVPSGPGRGRLGKETGRATEMLREDERYEYGCLSLVVDAVPCSCR
jgi:hypothetical protein